MEWPWCFRFDRRFLAAALLYPCHLEAVSDPPEASASGKARLHRAFAAADLDDLDFSRCSRSCCRYGRCGRSGSRRRSPGRGSRHPRSGPRWRSICCSSPRLGRGRGGVAPPALPGAEFIDSMKTTASMKGRRGLARGGGRSGSSAGPAPSARCSWGTIRCRRRRPSTASPGAAAGSDGGVGGAGVAGSVCSEPALTRPSSDAGPRRCLRVVNKGPEFRFAGGSSSMQNLYIRAWARSDNRLQTWLTAKMTKSPARRGGRPAPSAEASRRRTSATA